MEVSAHFIYSVTVNLEKWQEQNLEAENLKDRLIIEKFPGSDPFALRQEAFDRALSYRDNFHLAEKCDVENFAGDEKGVSQTYIIEVKLIDPFNGHELLLHKIDSSCIRPDEENLDMNELEVEPMLLDLLSEFACLHDFINNETKIVNAVFKYPDGAQSEFRILPTPYFPENRTIMSLDIDKL